MPPAPGRPLHEAQYDSGGLIVEPAPLVSAAGPVAPGETAEATVSLINDDEQPVQIEFLGTDLVSQDGKQIQADNVVFQPRGLMLEPGRRGDIKIHVTVPVRTPAGTYSGLIRAAKLDGLHAVLIVQVERVAHVPRDDIGKENTPATINEARQAARIRLVEEHVRVENTRDIEATLGTFGRHPHCVVNGENLYGHDSIRGFYESFFRAFPDLKVTVDQRHVSAEAITLEVTLTGTHLGTFGGIPASGRRIAIPLCAIFKFDEDERILGEWVYFDNALVMEQLRQRSGQNPQR
jgi:steroid delta-isomerase-like uncharacterized protein